LNRPAVIQDVSEALAECKNNAVPVSARLTFKIEKKFLQEKLATPFFVSHMAILNLFIKLFTSVAYQCSMNAR
jgi:hypothetical protein